jgi:hypothetical protein
MDNREELPEGISVTLCTSQVSTAHEEKCFKDLMTIPRWLSGCLQMPSPYTEELL